MRFLLRLFLLGLLWAGAVAQAETSLRSARAAQTLLGPSVWSRVIRVDNHNRRSAYATTFYALVFEYADRLWFYTDADGTQSFSLLRSHLAQDKADFGPLLHAIDPGLTHYEVVAADPTAASAARPRPGELPNGCLIDSIAAFGDQLAHGEPILSARLLMYYSDERVAGHCVLTYETPAGIFVVDSSQRGGVRRIGATWPSTDLRLAREVAPGRAEPLVTQAKSLALPLHDIARTAYLASARQPMAADAPVPN